uniref:Uncharacterized protein n=1 Tax=Anguilla anguilla TaxID=7936 RepID=A0A0E9S683_ANGAN
MTACTDTVHSHWTRTRSNVLSRTIGPRTSQQSRELESRQAGSLHSLNEIELTFLIKLGRLLLAPQKEVVGLSHFCNIILSLHSLTYIQVGCRINVLR